MIKFITEFHLMILKFNCIQCFLSPGLRTCMPTCESRLFCPSVCWNRSWKGMSTWYHIRTKKSNYGMWNWYHTFSQIFINMIMLFQMYVNLVPNSVTTVCEVGTTVMDSKSFLYHGDFKSMSTWYHMGTTLSTCSKWTWYHTSRVNNV